MKNIKLNKKILMPISAIIGFLGVLLLPLKPIIGLPLFIAAGALIVVGIRSGGAAKPAPRVQIPPIQTVSSRFEAESSPRSLKPGRETYQPLLYALTSSERNINAPVIETAQGPVTARDIVMEIANAVEAHADNVSDVGKLMPAMYDMMWDYAAEAIAKYPRDIELIKDHIAAAIYFRAQQESKIK
jgi:hypothetical protein